MGEINNVVPFAGPADAARRPEHDVHERLKAMARRFLLEDETLLAQDPAIALAAALPQLREVCNASRTDAELDRSCTLLYAAERLLAKTRATSMKGVVAKLRAFRERHPEAGGLDWRLLDSAIRDAARLGRGWKARDARHDVGGGAA